MKKKGYPQMHVGERRWWIKSAAGLHTDRYDIRRETGGCIKRSSRRDLEPPLW